MGTERGWADLVMLLDREMDQNKNEGDGLKGRMQIAEEGFDRGWNGWVQTLYSCGTGLLVQRCSSAQWAVGGRL